MKVSKNLKVNFTRIILTTIATVGLLSVAIMMPNVMISLKKLGFLGNKKYRPKNYINKRIEIMLNSGLINKVKEGGSIFFVLTEKGMMKLNRYKILESKNIPKKWDKKWRILIFDVWEKRRNSRNMLRNQIQNYGFIKLQQSVWVYPYPCNQFVELLKVDLKFGKNIRYIIAEKIDNDASLMKIFNLER